MINAWPRLVLQKRRGEPATDKQRPARQGTPAAYFFSVVVVEVTEPGSPVAGSGVFTVVDSVVVDEGGAGWPGGTVTFTSGGVTVTFAGAAAGAGSAAAGSVCFC